MLRDMSYIDTVATARMRESLVAAVSAIPLKPQMPRTPMRLRSTDACSPRKSTAALKSSVLMSGDAVFRGSPLLSPVYDGSKASVTNPRSAIVCAYRPGHLFLDGAKRTADGQRRQAVASAVLRHVQVGGERDAESVLERDLLMIDLVASGERLVPCGRVLRLGGGRGRHQSDCRKEHARAIPSSASQR